MKKYLLILTFLFTAPLNAQSLLPKAGEFLSDEISKQDLIKSTMPKAPYSDEKLTVIDFDSSNVSFKGNFPFSYCYALAMSSEGDLVFVGSGGGLYVTDVSDPQNPVILSEIRTRSLIDQCTYDPISKRLYVCAYFSGIEIWDLSDLSNPTRMSRFPTEPYPRSGIAFIGDYLFFTTNYSIWSLDISDPYNPVFADELFLANNLISQMYVNGDRAYIVMSSQGLKVVNVSNPLNLQLIDSYGILSGNEIDIVGDILYAVNSSGSLTIYGKQHIETNNQGFGDCKGPLNLPLQAETSVSGKDWICRRERNDSSNTEFSIFRSACILWMYLIQRILSV